MKFSNIAKMLFAIGISIVTVLDKQVLAATDYYSLQEDEVENALALYWSEDEESPVAEFKGNVVFRSYDTFLHDHFYTASTVESRIHCENEHVACEGGGFVTFPRDQTEGLVPVYRLYLVGAEHFYTTSEDEKNTLLASTDPAAIVDEGVLGYCYTSPINDEVKPVYRLFRLKQNDHIYTMDEDEREYLLNVGNVDEDILCYSYELPDNLLEETIAHQEGRAGYYFKPETQDALGLYHRIDESTGEEEYMGNVFFRTNDRSINDHFYTTSLEESRIHCLPNANVDCDGGSFLVFPHQLGGTVPIYRFLRPGKDHVYTSSEAEKNGLMRHVDFVFQGAVGYCYSTRIDSEVAPVYRLYRETLHDHVYTVNEAERQSLLDSGARDEGILCYARVIPNVFLPEVLALQKTAPNTHSLYPQNVDALGLYYHGDDGTGAGEHLGNVVFRTYDTNSKDHFYTTSLVESMSHCSSPHTDCEGGGFLAFPDRVAGTVPVYRLHRRGKDHFYTTNEVEKNTLQFHDPEFDYEGVMGYCYPTQVSSELKPVYRFNRRDKNDHVYTMNEGERHHLLASGAIEEGVMCYSHEIPYFMLARILARQSDFNADGFLTPTIRKSAMCLLLNHYGEDEMKDEGYCRANALIIDKGNEAYHSDNDAFFVKRIGNTVYAGIKGSQSSSVLDWSSNLDCFSTQLYGMNGNNLYGGRESFHGGLLNSWIFMRDKFFKKIIQSCDGTCTNIVLTGHSRGAALINFAWLQLLAELEVIKSITVLAHRIDHAGNPYPVTLSLPPNMGREDIACLTYAEPNTAIVDDLSDHYSYVQQHWHLKERNIYSGTTDNPFGKNDHCDTDDPINGWIFQGAMRGICPGMKAIGRTIKWCDQNHKLKFFPKAWEGFNKLEELHDIDTYQKIYFRTKSFEKIKFCGDNSGSMKCVRDNSKLECLQLDQKTDKMSGWTDEQKELATDQLVDQMFEFSCHQL